VAQAARHEARAQHLVPFLQPDLGKVRLQEDQVGKVGLRAPAEQERLQVLEHVDQILDVRQIERAAHQVALPAQERDEIAVDVVPLHSVGLERLQDRGGEVRLLAVRGKKDSACCVDVGERELLVGGGS